MTTAAVWDGCSRVLPYFVFIDFADMFLVLSLYFFCFIIL